MCRGWALGTKNFKKALLEEVEDDNEPVDRPEEVPRYDGERLSEANELGWEMLPAIILLSSLVGATIGIAMIAFANHEKSKPIPFGPYLAIAGWIALVWGQQINQAYLHYMGLA